MQLFSTRAFHLIAAGLLALGFVLPVAAQDRGEPGQQHGQRGQQHGQQREGHHGGMGGGREHRLFVTVTGSATQDRAMPLTLANKAVDQGLEVRVLLCGDGAELALADYQAGSFDPPGLTPKDLLGRLLQHEVTVEVCAIFLPNTEYSEEDLTDGIGIGAPDDVTAWMMGPRTRIFSN